MANVCEALVSAPPFEVPPLSCRVIVIVAEPLAFAAGVYVKVPVGLIDGPAENNPGFVLPVTLKCTVWADSSDGPGLIAVAHPVTVCAPAFSRTDWSAPLVKVGASFTAVTLMLNVCGALVST